MSSDWAVEVTHLSKAYLIRHAKDRATTLGEAVARRIRRPFGEPEAEQFWALNDISFRVQKGEVVGVIGRNGAGKSTLLKILSRITEPTAGEVRIWGRVGSLLEVGTGFHPELTGRENIFLNGAILGMRHGEIARRFDEIVAFAEVTRFLDTPVKHYSTGMYVRLAFAVAAHLNAEILLVDEVLAVGDAAFQKKCLARMENVRREGRTVLFVSHNFTAVRSLCPRTLVLTAGSLTALGPTPEVLDTYLTLGSQGSSSGHKQFERPPGAEAWIRWAELRSKAGVTATIQMGDPLSIELAYAANPPTRQIRFGWVISTADGAGLACANNRYLSSSPLLTPAGSGVIRADLGVVPLMPGRYYVSLYLGNESTDTHCELEALGLLVLECDLWGAGKLPPAHAAAMWWPTTIAVTADPEVDAGAS